MAPTIFYNIWLMSVLSLALSDSVYQTKTDCITISGTYSAFLTSAITNCIAFNQTFKSCSAGPYSIFKSCLCKQQVVNNIVK